MINFDHLIKINVSIIIGIANYFFKIVDVNVLTY